MDERRSPRISAVSGSSIRLGFQHSPSSQTEAYRSTESFDSRCGERLGEHVGDHVVCRTVSEANFAIFDGFANEMMTDVKMLGTGVIHRVLSERDSGLVVAIDEKRLREWTRDLGEKLV